MLFVMGNSNIDERFSSIGQAIRQNLTIFSNLLEARYI